MRKTPKMSPIGSSLHKIWNIELDLLEKLKEICTKYHLNYCASSGTLLGAVRHKGFIPWDDDIDIFLPWSDYKILLEKAPKECEYPYFFQSFLTDPDSEASASRLRRSDTTGYTQWEHDNMGPDYNKGIFIDIFPLFNIPDSDTERAIQKESIMFFWKCMRGYNAYQQARGNKVNPLYKDYLPYYLSVQESMSIQEIKWAYLNACAMKDGHTREVGATSSRVHQPNLMWDSELYNDFIDLPFESTTIRCPSKYEKVLDKQFGNWRIPIKNGARHEMYIVNTEIPYEDYNDVSQPNNQ